MTQTLVRVSPDMMLHQRRVLGVLSEPKARCSVVIYDKCHTRMHGGTYCTTLLTTHGLGLLCMGEGDYTASVHDLNKELGNPKAEAAESSAWKQENKLSSDFDRRRLVD